MSENIDALVAFLKERYDEAQQRVDSMEHFANVEDEFYSCPAARTETYGDLEWGEDACICGLARRKACDLRTIGAGRMILAMYENPGAYDVPGDVIVQLGTVFSDHPDYRPSFSPGHHVG